MGVSLHVALEFFRAVGPGRLADAAEQAFGQVDCLVNNVGVAYQTSFEELTDEDWASMWELNVMSYVRAIKAALPGMRERGAGRIVNVGSTAGKRPSTGMPNYSVTKAACSSRYPALSLTSMRRTGSSATPSRPGPTASPAWLAAGGLADQSAERTGKSREEILDGVGKGRPLGRLAEPEEIAAVIVFRCSDRASVCYGSAWSAGRRACSSSSSTVSGSIGHT